MRHVDARNALIVALFGAAGIGLLAWLGAPGSMLIANSAGLLCGLTGYGLVRVLLRSPPPVITATVVVLAMIAVAVWGYALDGVHRWLRLGPFTLHVGFVLLPLLMLVCAAGRWIAPVAFACVGLGIWLQPDAGMASAIAVASIALLAATRTIAAGAGAVASVGWAVATWLRPDPLEPVRYVEHVVELAWARDALTGGAATLMLAAIPVIFVVLGGRDRSRRPVCWSLAGFWAGAAAASLAGHFPTPVIGMGIGPIIGFALSFAVCASVKADGKDSTPQRSDAR